MANVPGIPSTSTLSQTASDVSQSAMHGLSVAASQESYDLVLELVGTMGLPQGAMTVLRSTLIGQVALYFCVPSALIFACNAFPSSIPHAANVKAACKLIIDGSSRDFLRPLFHALSNPLRKLADVGAKINAEKGSVEL